jgi:two-component system, response regulator PdtaR
MLFGKRERVVKRILIVEDEPLVAFDNEVTLADLGYEVVATLDGFDDAIATLDKEDVDLVLSDLRLRSEQSGLDLARAAKQRGIPLLFSTGFDLPEEAKSISVGCLRKPHSERQLKKALDSVDRLLAGEKGKAFKGFELFPDTKP